MQSHTTEGIQHTGQANYVYNLYLSVQKKERQLERAQQELEDHVIKLSPDDFKAYAVMTMAHDRKQNLLEE